MKEPVWIDERDALKIHERLLALHGGASGLREKALLSYTVGIVGNHPFVDGNKRTGFVIGVLFLELNGYRFTAGEEDATQAIISLAAGLLDEDGFIAFLRANTIRQNGCL